MTKYLLIIGFSFLFLCSCGSDPKVSPGSDTDSQAAETSVKPDGKPGSSVTEREPDAPLRVPPLPLVSPDRGGQSCTTNLINVTWRCVAGTATVEYFVDHRPVAIDDEGTDKERRRVCELSQTFEGTTKVINYAHNEKDWCVKKLNEELTAKRNSNFKCEKVNESIDSNRASEPCPIQSGSKSG